MLTTMQQSWLFGARARARELERVGRSGVECLTQSGLAELAELGPAREALERAVVAAADAYDALVSHAR